MPKSLATVRDEFVDFLKGAFVEQELDALAGGELAFLVLARAAFRAAAGFGKLIATLQFGKLLLQVHSEGL